MGLRRNLSPNPGLANDATGWSSSPAGWARRFVPSDDLEVITWAGNEASGSDTSVAVANDAAMQADDERFVVISISNETVTTPVGWEEVNPGGSVIASTRRIYWFRRTHAGGSESASYSFTFSAAANHSMAQFAVRAADPATPIDAAVVVDSATSGSSVTAPSVNTATDGAILVTSHHAIANGTSVTMSLPTGMSDIATGTGTGSAGHAYRVAYEVRPTAGPTGVRTSTSTNASGNAWGASALAIRPAPIDASVLPRPYAYQGTTAGDVNTPRAAVTPGESYVFSLSVRALAAQDFAASVNWYSALSGGSFISNTGAVDQDDLIAGQTDRIVIGPYVAPAGAASAQFKLNGADAGGLQVTAVRVSPSSGDLDEDSEFFDGETAGATWDGAVGGSTSTFRILTETITFSDGFSKSETALGPVGSDAFGFSEVFSIAAASTAVDEFTFADSFLVASASFDETIGRVRIEAFTFPDVVTAMRVSSRIVGRTWQLLRGGLVPVIGGLAVRPVDDFEYAAGYVTEYLIEGLDEAEAVRTSAVVSRDGAGDRPWLKFIANPASNTRVVLVDEPVRISRPARTALYDVQGRSDPVVVSDVHGSRRLTVRVVVDTPAAAEQLDATLALGVPLYLQVPPGGPVPSVYATVGDYEWEPPTRTSPRSIFTLPLTEVAAPPPTIAGAFATYQTVLDTYPTYEAVLAAVATYRELAT